MSALIIRLPVPARQVAERIEVDVAGIRRSLRLDRSTMAAAFGIARRDLDRWERGDGRPTGLVRVLLVVAAREPDAVRRTLVCMGLVRQ